MKLKSVEKMRVETAQEAFEVAVECWKNATETLKQNSRKNGNYTSTR